MLNIHTITCQIENEEILYVSWVDYDPFMKFNFEMYFFNLIEKVNRSDIKKLVLDCSCRRHDPSENDFKDIYELLLSGLSSTRLEKMARICPVPAPGNARFTDILESVKIELNIRFHLGSFKSAESAFAWLREENLHFRVNSRQSA